MVHRGPVVELEVRANADRLTRKLRAIASAANSLADEESQVMEPGFYSPAEAARATIGGK